MNDIKDFDVIESKPDYTEDDISRVWFGSSEPSGVFGHVQNEYNFFNRYGVGVLASEEGFINKRTPDILRLADNTEKLILDNRELAESYSSIYNQWLTENLPQSKDVKQDKISDIPLLPENVLNGYIIAHTTPEGLKNLGYGEEKDIYAKFSEDLAKKYNADINPHLLQSLVMARRLNDEKIYNDFRSKENFLESLEDAFLGRQIGVLTAGTDFENFVQGAKDAGIVASYGLAGATAVALLPFELPALAIGAGLTALATTGLGWSTGVFARNFLATAPVDAFNAISDHYINKKKTDQFGGALIASEDKTVGQFLNEEIFNAGLGVGIEGAFKIGSLAFKKAVSNAVKYSSYMDGRFKKTNVTDNVLQKIASEIEMNNEPRRPISSETFKEYLRSDKPNKDTDLFQLWQQEIGGEHDGTVLGASKNLYGFYQDSIHNAEEEGSSWRAKIDNDFISTSGLFDTPLPLDEQTELSTTLADERNKILNNINVIALVEDAKRINPTRNYANPFNVIKTLKDNATNFDFQAEIAKSMMQHSSEYFKASESEKREMARSLLSDPAKRESFFRKGVTLINDTIREEKRKVGEEYRVDDELSADHIPHNWRLSITKQGREQDDFIRESFPVLDSEKMLHQKLERYFDDNISDEELGAVRSVLSDLWGDVEWSTVKKRDLKQLLISSPDLFKNVISKNQGISSLSELRSVANKELTQQYKDLKELTKDETKKRNDELKRIKPILKSSLNFLKRGKNFDLTSLGKYQYDFARRNVGFHRATSDLISSLSDTKSQYFNAMEDLGYSNKELIKFSDAVKNLPDSTNNILDDPKRTFDSMLKNNVRTQFAVNKQRQNDILKARKNHDNETLKQIRDLFKGEATDLSKRSRLQKTVNNFLTRETEKDVRRKLKEAFKNLNSNHKELLTQNKKLERAIDLEIKSRLNGILKNQVKPENRELVKSTLKGMRILGKPAGINVFDRLNSAIKKTTNTELKSSLSMIKDQVTRVYGIPENVKNLQSALKKEKINIEKDIRKNIKIDYKSLRENNVPSNILGEVKKLYSAIAREIKREREPVFKHDLAEINLEYDVIIEELKNNYKFDVKRIKDIKSKTSKLIEGTAKLTENEAKNTDKEVLKLINDSRMKQRVSMQNALTASKNLRKNKRLGSLYDSIDELIAKRDEGYTIDDYKDTLGALGRTDVDDDTGMGYGGGIVPKRYIHFDPLKSEQEIGLLDKYGDTPVGANLLEQMINRNARLYAQLSTLGLPSEGQTFKSLADSQKADVANLLNLSGINKNNKTKWQKSLQWSLEAHIDYMGSGGQFENSTTNIGLALYGTLANATNLMSLGSTIYISDSLNMAFRASALSEGGFLNSWQDGMNAFSKYVHQALTDLKPSTEDIETLLLHTDNYARNYSDLMKMQLANNTKEVSGMKQAGIEAINGVNRYFETVTRSQSLTQKGNMVARELLVNHFTNPTDYFKDRMLIFEGVTAHDWEFLKENAKYDSKNRVILASISDTDEGKKLIRAFGNEARRMIPMMSQDARVLFRKLSTGVGIVDGIIRNISYLKAIPTIEMADKLKQFVNTGWAGRSALIAQSVLTATLIVTVHNFLRGRKTDLTNPEQMYRILSTMPLVGPFGNMLDIMHSQHGKEDLGGLMLGPYEPAYDAIAGTNRLIKREKSRNSIIGKNGFHTHNFFNLTNKINPIARTPALNILWDRFVMDNAIKSLDPQGYEYIRKRNGYDKKRGNERIFKN